MSLKKGRVLGKVVYGKFKPITEVNAILTMATMWYLSSYLISTVSRFTVELEGPGVVSEMLPERN